MRRPLLAAALVSLLSPALRAQTFQGLGILGGASPYSAATGVSADGAVVAVTSTVPDRPPG
jgi:uncharacterized membrane protein